MNLEMKRKECGNVEIWKFGNGRRVSERVEVQTILAPVDCKSAGAKGAKGANGANGANPLEPE